MSEPQAPDATPRIAPAPAGLHRPFGFRTARPAGRMGRGLGHPGHGRRSLRRPWLSRPYFQDYFRLILIFFFAWLLAFIISPVADWLQRHLTRLPRPSPSSP